MNPLSPAAWLVDLRARRGQDRTGIAHLKDAPSASTAIMANIDVIERFALGTAGILSNISKRGR